MRPKTKLDCRIKALSDDLPKPTADQLDKAKLKCFTRRAIVRKSGAAYCLECGHEWKIEGKPGKRIACPSCKEKLATVVTLKRSFTQDSIFAMLHVVEGMQVVRLFYIEKSEKIGTAAYYYVSELIQQWYINDGKRVIVACGTSNGYWRYSSMLEIRKETSIYGYYQKKYDYIPAYVCSGWEVLPAVKRSGFNGDFHGADPWRLLRWLPNEPMYETLLKSKQYALFAAHVNNTTRISAYWRSVCICNRNKYIVKDASMWKDYLDLLLYFGKDLHNAKYVCPKNLKSEHDKLVKKKRTLAQREEAEAKRKRAIADQRTFKKLKSAFFGLCFSSGDLKVGVIDSVDRIALEGDKMHHCVFACNYHLKEDSLILSATYRGERVETVEVSLKEFKVVQSRGVCNRVTDYHDQIINLVGKNINKIKQRANGMFTDTATGT